MSARDWSDGFSYRGTLEVHPRDGGPPIVYDVAGYQPRRDGVDDGKSAAKIVLGELVDRWARIRPHDDGLD